MASHPIDESALKQRYLVAYDYGQGAIWGFVLARSKLEIARRYPKLEIADDVPQWMSPERLARMESEKTFDLDDRAGLWKAGLIED